MDGRTRFFDEGGNQGMILRYFALWLVLGIILPGCGVENEKESPQVLSDTSAKLANPIPGGLIPSEYIWFYGIIPQDGWVTHHYRLTNPQKDTVTITRIVPGCDCSRVPKPPLSIPPGGSYLLKTEFDTKTYFRETNRDIEITTDYAPNPEMFLYFGSLIGRPSNTVEIVPRSTVFISGKNAQVFTIRNLTAEKASFRLFIDNDSTLQVSEHEFEIEGHNEFEITVSPLWEKFTVGATYSCLVLEVIRDKPFRITIPIKVNLF